MTDTKQTFEWCGNALDRAIQPWDSVIDVSMSCGAFCYGGTASLEISEENKQFIKDCFEIQAITGKTMVQLTEENTKLIEALRDMYEGWKYIRSTHGDLYGVGWDRAQQKAEKALGITND